MGTDCGITSMNGVSVIQLDSAAQEVTITWPDDHRSVFRYGWLLARSFRYAEQAARARWNGRHPVLWGGDLADRIPQVEFSQVGYLSFGLLRDLARFVLGMHAC